MKVDDSADEQMASHDTQDQRDRTKAKDEIEADNNSKKKRDSTDGQEADLDSNIPQRRILKYVGWKQTEHEVTCVLEAPGPITNEDLHANFSDTEATISLKGGGEWKCVFQQEIERQLSRVLLQDRNKVLMKVRKKEPELQWTQLEASSHHDTEVVNIKGKTEDFQDDMYQLSHVKHDWFEKGAGTLVTHIYVRQTFKEEVVVQFGDTSVTVQFRTQDTKFLSLHEGTTKETVFCWSFKVVDKLAVSNCTYRVSGTMIELQLAKQVARRWGTLEAAQGKGVPSAMPPTKDWIPASKGPSETPSNKQSSGAATPNPSKIAFDEMNTENKQSSDYTEKDMKSSSCKSSKNILGDSNKDSAQKPTCMVSPLTKSLGERPDVVRPGMTGLDNLGNTCFMNSVLQILANSRELRDYFLEGKFQKEINTENPLGTGGKLAVSFAVLMKVLWSNKHLSYAPSKLKNLIALKASQFTGFAQHDAQEFMAFLLDGLHEDLNRIKEKPYTETVESDDRPDEAVAEEAWNVHKKRNDSFIVDTFQGQYKSKLVCPQCGKVSITFDPFMILPVPLPKKQRVLPVVFMSKDYRRKPIKFLLKLDKDASVEQLKEMISRKTGANPKDLRVFESYKHSIHQFLGKGTSLSHIQPGDKISVCEVLSDAVAGEPVLEIVVLQRVLIPQGIPSHCSYCKRECAPGDKLKRCTRCFRTAYCDHDCQKKDWQRHRGGCKYSPELVGEPFYISLPESQATYSRITQMMEAMSRHSVDVFQPPVSEIERPVSPSSGVSSISSSPLSSRASHTVTSSDKLETVTAETSSTSGLGSDISSECGGGNGSVEGCAPKQGEGDGTNMGLLSDAGISVPPGEDADNSTLSLDIHKLETGDNSEKSDPEKKPNPENDACSPTREAPTSGNNTTPPTRYVLGRQQDQEPSKPMFFIKPVDKDGHSLSGSDRQRLEDKGDEPLKLSSFYLAMDWRNNDKASPHVLVQSKLLDADEDPSMQSYLADDNKTTLEQCMSLFTEPEVLSPEHAWYCPSCKEFREATKQLSIWRLPHTLIVQLKRFSFRNLLWRDKIDKMVDFPIQGLDLSPFLVGGGSGLDQNPLYDLYGVINHHGGILGGHYTAYGRCPDLDNWRANQVGWRLFDDSVVSQSSEKHVATRAAYVLFYRRRDTIVKLASTEVPTWPKDEDNRNTEDSDDGSETETSVTESPQPKLDGVMSVSQLSHSDMDALD